MGIFALTHWMIVAVQIVLVMFGAAFVARLAIPFVRVFAKVRAKQLKIRG